MSNVIAFRRIYAAKAFAAPWENQTIALSGTLDGFIDLAMPKGGTYPLSLGEAKLLLAALNGAIRDVEAHCLGERDALLSPTSSPPPPGHRGAPNIR